MRVCVRETGHMARLLRQGLRASPVAVAAAFVVLLGACGLGRAPVSTQSGTDAPDSSSTSSHPSTARTDPLTFTVVGDSLTSGTAPGSTPEDVDGGSWVHAATGKPLRYTGGWAVAGATTAQMLAGVEPVTADVVVIMAGTNDLVQSVPTDVTLADLTAIATRVGAGRVLLCAIPPSQDYAASAEGLNRSLAALARSNGWGFVDPWSSVDDEGSWVAGASLDGVHPVLAVARTVGAVIRTALLDGPGSSRTATSGPGGSD